MKVLKTKFKDCYILEPKIIGDSRGYFFESFHQNNFETETGVKVQFVQDNQSFSKRGTLRGLHFQKGEWSQAKLVQVISGAVLDVVVDLRKDSGTFGEHFSIELSCENKKQLFIPKGFAHGFVVLSKSAEFFYKCDNYYNKESEGGIIYDDPDFNINWGISHAELIVSEKDLNLPNFQEISL